MPVDARGRVDPARSRRRCARPRCWPRSCTRTTRSAPSRRSPSWRGWPARAACFSHRCRPGAWLAAARRGRARRRPALDFRPQVRAAPRASACCTCVRREPLAPIVRRRRPRVWPALGHGERRGHRRTWRGPSSWPSPSGEAAATRIGALRDRLEAGMLAAVPDVTINGRRAAPAQRCHVTLRGSLRRRAADRQLDLAGVAVSAGSACTSGSPRAQSRDRRASGRAGARRRRDPVLIGVSTTASTRSTGSWRFFPAWSLGCGDPLARSTGGCRLETNRAALEAVVERSN